MEKVDEFISKVPGIIIKTIQEQQNFMQYQTYIQKVQNDIKYFQKHKSFPKPLDGDVKSSINANGTVLTENTYKDVQIKLERISEIPQKEDNVKSSINDFQKENMNPVKLEMPPPQLPIKKARQIKKEPSTANTRSTRSKASRQMQMESDDTSPDSDVIIQKQIIETITLTDSDNEDVTNANKISKQSNSKLEDHKSDVEDTPATTRTTRTKTRTKKNNEENGKSNSKLEDDKSDVEDMPTTIRATRTKTRMKKNNEENGKRTRSSSSNVNNLKNTETVRQTKRKKSEESGGEEVSQYEDANSNLSPIEKSKTIDANVPQGKLNETYVMDPKQIDSNLNETVTIQGKLIGNTTFALEKEPPEAIDKTVTINGSNVVDNGCLIRNINDIMTDDEDDKVVTVPKKATYNVKAGAKTIFNPFEGSPVKKRVEAFEKLVNEDISGIPLRSTRNVTRINAKEKGEALTLTPKYPKQTREMKTTPKVANKYLATVSNSASKAVKTNMMSESFLPTKASSALKSSQQEFNERETKRREKELEAMKKRMAQMHAQAEDKKKKRLEKQIKAQQVREIQERSKIEALREAEKAKEERHKQMLVEKQEKAKKLHEEAERRRAEALRKALEEKRKEEERKRTVEEAQEKLKQEELRKAMREERRAARVLEQKKKPRNRLPIYLREKAPLLPTEDCYDSDQEGVDVRKVKRPTWTFSQKMFPQLKKMKRTDKKVISSFFIMVVTTPNLQDIFENIDPLKLKRTSSAIWKAPPRYTLMPESIEEKDEEGY